MTGSPTPHCAPRSWPDAARAGLALSIDLGGMLVLAGDDAALAAFTAAVPATGRFPMRLQNHAAFHTNLMAPVATAGQARLAHGAFRQPKVPLIDGRGAIWWPGATDTVRFTTTRSAIR